MTTSILFRPATREFKRRQTLPRGEFWRIREGLVRSLTWDEDGEAVALGLWGPGDIVSTRLSSLNPYELEALTATVVETVNPDDLDLATVLTEHFGATEQLLSITRTRLAEARFSRLLEWLGHRFGVVSNNAFLIDLNRIYLTHQTLGELTGSTRVTITRLLNAFERRGVITYERNRRMRIAADGLPHLVIASLQTA